MSSIPSNKQIHQFVMPFTRENNLPLQRFLQYVIHKKELNFWSILTNKANTYHSLNLIRTITFYENCIHSQWPQEYLNLLINNSINHLYVAFHQLCTCTYIKLQCAHRFEHIVQTGIFVMKKTYFALNN